MIDRQVIIEKLKTARSRRLLTNCYSLDVVDKAESIWEKEGNFIFSYNDHGVKRLIYAALDWKELDCLIDLIDGGTYYLEYIAKDNEEHMPAHSSFTAKMLRFSNADARSVFDSDSHVLRYRNSAVMEWAKEEDAKEINQILWSVFHTEISHLLYDEEIKERIQKRQITIHRESNSVDALLYADVLPKNFYINQIVNKTDRGIIHAILLDRLEQYVNNGGKYLYAWIDESNIPSIKFHRKYGMEKDGNCSVIYQVKRI